MISDNEGFKNSGFDRTIQNVGGDQRAMWRYFYGGQWEARRQYIENQIESGETNAARLLGLLEKFERKNTIKQQFLFSASGELSLTGEIQPIQFTEERTPAGVPGFRTSSLRGQLLQVPYHTPDSYVNFLVDVIDETGPYDAVVELGCGYGKNLLGIHFAGGPKGIPYFGGELVPNGRDLATRLAGLTPDLDLSIHAFDHLDPDLSFLPKVERLFVFTVHSLEQVERIGPVFFEAIAQAAPQVTTIHLEPFGFQIQDLGPATKTQREYFQENRWNSNLWQALNQAKDSGILDIEFAALELFLPADSKNATSLAMWRNK